MMSISGAMVVLSRIPFTDAVAEQVRIVALVAYGVDVIVYDLSFLNKKYQNIEATVTKCPVVKIKTISEFKHRLKTFHPHVYLDLIYGLSGIQADAYHIIFRLLKKYNAQYYVLAMGTLPSTLVRDNRRSFQQIMKKIKLIKNLSVLSAYVKASCRIIGNKLIRRLIDHYQLPLNIFSCTNEVLDSYLTRYNLSKVNVIPIHSLDYDRYLLNQNKTKPVDIPNNYCVFADDGLVAHPDFSVLNDTQKPVMAKSYQRSICQFFDRVEELTGLEVVIAAHPRVNYDASPNLFGNRKIIQGKTIQLIEHSQLVLTHYSTSISYAILYNKPLALLLTDEMIQKNYDRMSYTFSATLGIPVFNMDEDREQNDNLADYSNWVKDYDHYRYSYIQSKLLGDSFFWETVVKELKQDFNREI